MLSERAIKECPSKTCLACGKPVTDEDRVIINGGKEEQALLRDRMKRLRAEAKKAKVLLCCASVKPARLGGG